jgi:hypothetical protein
MREEAIYNVGSTLMVTGMRSPKLADIESEVVIHDLE